ncbi:MAG: hypothetical protein SWK76_13010 [Actinomycetota bacterium]|nr:hypothetical protein [Actinomycetota bacterium]
MLTLFTVPKPFEGHIGVIQRNAIQSWRRLHADLEIFLFSDEKGISEMAVECGAEHISRIKCNEYGTPMLDSIFEAAIRLAGNRILCYVNADIILMNDFAKAVSRVMSMDSFLMVGRRWDMDIREPLNFSDPRWEEELRAQVKARGKLHQAYGIDYFTFNRDLLGDAMPPFAVGRPTWDNWFIYNARRTKVPVIDATPAVTAVHQNHHYNPVLMARDESGEWKGPEVSVNRELAGKRASTYNVNDATLVLYGESLIKQKKRVKARRFLTISFPGVANKVVRLLRNAGLYEGVEE